MKTARPTEKCQKCNGSGWLNFHLNVDGGRCFDCGGAGVREIDTRPARGFAVAITAEHLRHELRNLYRAARSQRGQGWGEDSEEDCGFDVARSVAEHLVDLPAAEHAAILAAFRGVVTAKAHGRIAGFLAAAQARNAARAA